MNRNLFGIYMTLLTIVLLADLSCGKSPENKSGFGDPDSGADGDSDADADGDSDADADSDICAAVDVAYELKSPTVMLLIDQSGSMEEDFGSTDRWMAVEDTLFDPVSGIVARMESEIRFGMQLYTSHGGFAGGQCPILTGLPAGLDNYNSLKKVFADNNPETDTPTGEALLATVEILKADTNPNNKIIVLATDGEPDTCEVPNPQEGQSESIAAAQAAHKAGFPVYIISVGNQVGEQHLQQMANAGQGYSINDPNGAEYYMGLDPSSLEGAFAEIVEGIRECVLQVEGEVQEELAGSCKVTVDEDSIEYNQPNGWRLNSQTEIELLGTTCERIQSGMVNISVSCPCGAVIPVLR